MQSGNEPNQSAEAESVKTNIPPISSPENYAFAEGFHAQENVDPAVTKSLQIITKICLYAFIGAFVVSIFFFAWWGLKDYFVFGSQKFNQEQWLSAKPTDEERCHRGDMAYELKTKLLMKGMPRENAIGLLGAPTWADDDSIEYDLGHCLWVSHGLRLAFDDNSRLINSRIMQH